MASQQIVIEFTADISKLQPAIDALESLGQIDKKSAEIFRATNEEYKKRNAEVNKLSAAYNNLTEEVAAGGMKQHADDLKKGTDAIVAQKNETENLTRKLRQMVRELAAMKAEGRDNTEQFRQMSREAGKLADDIGDAREQVKVLSSDTKRLDAVAQAFRGVAAGMSIVTGASALLGDENKDLQKTLLQVQSAMAILNGVQEVATLVTGQNALKTMILDGAQKAVAVSARVMGVSVAAATALMTAGITVVLAAIGYFVTELMSANSETDKLKQKSLEFQKQQLDAQGQITDLRVSLIRDGKKRELAEQKVAEIRELESLRNRLRQGQIAGEQFEELYSLTRQKGAQAREEIELKYAKKSSDNNKKQIKETYDYLLETNDRMIAAEEKMLSEIMGLQARAFQEQRRIDEENEAWQMAQIQREIDREKAAEDEKIRIKQEAAEKEKQLRKQLQEEIQQNALLAAENTLNSIFELQANKRESEFNASMSMIEKQRDAVLSNDRLTNEQREAIEARYNEKVRRLKINAFIASQRAAENEAIINTALAVTKTFAQLGWPAGIPAAVAAGLAGAFQVAKIRSQPMPQFAEGTEFVEGAGTGTSDSITAKLSRGERVVTARTNKDYFDGLSVIHNRLVDPALVNTLLTNLAENGGILDLPAEKIKALENKGGIDYGKMAEAMKAGRSVVNIEMNEKGFVKHIQKGLNRSTYHNAKLRLRA